MAAKGKAAKGSSFEDKIHKRATWLNNNVFSDRRIDEEAVAAMQGMGASRAMELFKEIEEKADSIKNPSSYLKKAARREGFGPPLEEVKARSKGKESNSDTDKVQRRATWLNSNVFVDNPIDDDIVIAMQQLTAMRAMDLFKEIEEKAGSIQNPNSYLKSALRREGVGMAVAISSSVPGKTQSNSKNLEYEKVEKRATWLNKNVFKSSPIDEEAVAAMKGMGLQRAMELFREIEEKSDKMRNPSGYLKTAAMREGFGPPVPEKAKGKAKNVNSDSDRVQKRATWMNNNIFVLNPIDDDAVAAMKTLEVSRAMEIFKELEAKADTIKNPGAFLMTAVKREQGSQVRGVKRNSQGVHRPAYKQDTSVKKARLAEST